MRATRERDITVDTLRGIACILLVTLHVAHNKWDEAEWLPWYGDSFIYIRMPLFAFLSGVVYAWRPLAAPAGYRSFMTKKARRLLVPYVVFVPLIGFAQAVLGYGGGLDVAPLSWLLYSLAPYWFLLATFWVYAAVALADAYGLLSRRAAVAGVFGLLLAVNALFDTHDAEGLLQLTSAVYLGLFFIAGLAATRFGWRNVSRRIAWAVVAVTAALVAYTQLAVLGIWELTENPRRDLAGIALGVLFPLGLLGLGIKSRALAWIGDYSYGIFLLHPFMILGALAVLELAGVDSLPLSLLTMSAAGIFGSIAGVMLLRRFRAGRVTLGEPATRTVRAA